jgi:hypothetical protein
MIAMNVQKVFDLWISKHWMSSRQSLLTSWVCLANFVFGKLRELGWPLWNICVTNNHGYVPLVVNTSRSFPRSWIITGFGTRYTQRVPLVEQQLLTLPERLSSPLVFSEVRVSLVLCVWFVDRCLSFCPLSFGHCFVSPSTIYGFWLPPFWYLQTLLSFWTKLYYI